MGIILIDEEKMISAIEKKISDRGLDQPGILLMVLDIDPGSKRDKLGAFSGGK
jgi:hypothetical protein